MTGITNLTSMREIFQNGNMIIFEYQLAISKK